MHGLAIGIVYGFYELPEGHDWHIIYTNYFVSGLQAGLVRGIAGFNLIDDRVLRRVADDGSCRCLIRWHFQLKRFLTAIAQDSDGKIAAWLHLIQGRIHVLPRRRVLSIHLQDSVAGLDAIRTGCLRSGSNHRW